jgi:hypothetical protein
MTSSLREAESRRALARMRTDEPMGVWGKKVQHQAGELLLTREGDVRFYLQLRALPGWDECMVPAALANDTILPLTPASVVRASAVRSLDTKPSTPVPLLARLPPLHPTRALPLGVAEYEFLCKSRVRRNRKRKRLEVRGQIRCAPAGACSFLPFHPARYVLGCL